MVYLTAWRWRGGGGGQLVVNSNYRTIPSLKHNLARQCALQSPSALTRTHTDAVFSPSLLSFCYQLIIRITYPQNNVQQKSSSLCNSVRVSTGPSRLRRLKIEPRLLHTLGSKPLKTKMSTKTVCHKLKNVVKVSVFELQFCCNKITIEQKSAD